MKKSLNKYTIINIGFYGSLAINAIDALIEDPKDVIMNYFITFGQNISISSQHSVAIYILLHGA